jgi:hypothetical protein
MAIHDLFIKLAKPNAQGISRWVSKSEFIKFYKSLDFNNGLPSWGRKFSTLAKKYNVETDKSITSGVKIDRIRLNGFNTSITSNISQSIQQGIKKQIGSKRCAILGTHWSSGHKTEVDHKDGRKQDLRIMNTATQRLEDFQPLSKPANDAKRQFCKECKGTDKRYDAKLLGYTVSFIAGTINYENQIGCKGCYWHDPFAFNQALALK